jgi:hypothetical protein
MTETTFTPGPWHADKINFWNVWAPDCKVAKTFDVGQAPQYREPSETERIANAHLIAAAPDGYGASEAFVRAAIEEYQIPGDADESWILDTLGHGLGNAFLRALSFLAKARGEQSA